ncbi:hypothetical protein [Desulfosarcina sp.]|uniref:hypothetical protein n=1 Tax=Desulfosarcina sp. TaxID=2027861 RepID=UPI00397090A3
MLRTTGANDFLDVDAAARAPLFSIAKSDPEACTRFRSHLLARVQRCVKIDGHDENERYGIGAEIQMLTD